MPQRCYNGVRLLGNGPSLKNIERLDSGAMPMIIRMSQAGMMVDLGHFTRMERTLVDDMERITEEVRSMTGRYCNLNSGDQKSELLFKHLGLKQARPKMTGSGDRESVEDEVLTAIQHDHPVVPKMLEFAELSKLLGTYVRPMPKLARRVALGEWRMFPNLKYTRVPSSRLSCTDPNLLAMPSRTDRGREIRKGFVTRPGWKFVSVDESQIEPRLAAHCSQDPNLIRVYENEEDIYSDFAIAAFHLQDDRYQDENGKWIYPHVHKMNHRYPAKTCVLASIYDVSAPGLLEQMPIICANCGLEGTKHTCRKFQSLWNEVNCQSLIDAFYRKYPGVMADRLHNHAIAKKLGYVYDMWGRILHVAAVRSVLKWVVSAALREVGNFPYQSGAQGTIKLVMAQGDDQLEAEGMYEVVHPLLQIHDELLFEAREDVVEDLSELITWDFENCVRLNVPIKASAVSADTWGDLPK